MAKSTVRQVVFFFIIISWSGLLFGVRGSVCKSKSQRILCLILQDGFLFVHIYFGIMVKFQFLEQFPLMSSLTLPLGLSVVFVYYESHRCWEFFTSALADGFHWSLSDSKSPLVSRTLLSILLNNAVVWTVSTCHIISKALGPCTNLLATIPRAPITIGITVTFMFHSIFSSPARSWYLSLFSLSFNFTVWSAGTTKSTIL